MTSSVPVVVASLAFTSLVLAWHGHAVTRRERVARMIGVIPPTRRRPAVRIGSNASRAVLARAVVPATAGLVAGFLGGKLLGPAGMVAGVAAGVAAPMLARRRRGHRRAELLETQLTEAVEVTTLAVRSGFSLIQALQFAAGEIADPMSELLRAVAAEHRLGTPFVTAVRRFAESVGTDDSRLFGLVLGIHARSGGNLAGALVEVGTTLRHRQALRRELRAQTAQGRISGAILGALPIVFSLVLAITSRRQLAPVYRSTAGIAMVSAGLGLEALAYLWVRRLLRVTV